MIATMPQVIRAGRVPALRRYGTMRLNGFGLRNRDFEGRRPVSFMNRVVVVGIERMIVAKCSLGDGTISIFEVPIYLRLVNRLHSCLGVLT